MMMHILQPCMCVVRVRSKRPMTKDQVHSKKFLRCHFLVAYLVTEEFLPFLLPTSRKPLLYTPHVSSFYYSPGIWDQFFALSSPPSSPVVFLRQSVSQSSPPLFDGNSNQAQKILPSASYARGSGMPPKKRREQRDLLRIKFLSLIFNYCCCLMLSPPDQTTRANHQTFTSWFFTRIVRSGALLYTLIHS